ncbi:alginate lyase-domain-containing protein [Gamsiella multidivaricata]|uniref:alginate lyase-domain-containing protein n=1 Tax=Gamsiella multidivaricata TaxID=101098 RepID=UPI002221269F|nr:alginate lyase-domain-containing protein [Gamsiella multidivaricata]KAG0366936.1 hypothetical protein BGZ54_004682 [Gamsiella multidivaricata]KAI7832738.1 alginate lyase-domain-containing protein [Gamsiella multidivaricata]
MVYLRGPTKRTLTILLGLCIFVILFTFTPYSDKALDQLPDYDWRTSSKSSLAPEENQQPIAKQTRPKVDAEQQRQKYEQQDQERILRQKQQEEENRQEELLEKERLKEEAQQNDKELGEVNNDKILFENKETTKEGEKQQPKTEQEDDNSLEDGDLEKPQDGLPTEFNESLFPISSQKILETKIGAKAMKEYLHGKPRALLSRDSAIAYILGQANIAYRNDSVYSVVLKPKSKIAPSGDIHDYTSLARYFWKNPKTPDGLPYIRLDGQPNPDMDSVHDYRLLRKMFRDCYYMGMAYFWTGEERYAEKIVYRIKEWFVDRETYMNPNIKYGSLIFGNDLGRAQGVLDMFKVYGMFDGLRAIEGSKALQAEPALISDLRKWFTSYLEWMDGSIQANQEKNARNNHGTYFTVQYISILEFLGRNNEAKAMLEDAKEARVGSQIRKDGAQPHETIRPISFFYSVFNLQGLYLLAMQADSHGVDLWRHKGPIEESVIRVNSRVSVDIVVGGGTIEDATRYVSDYGVRDASEWPYPDSGSRPIKDVHLMAKVASVVYGRDRWQELIENLEAKIDEAIPGKGASEEGDNGGEGAKAAVPAESDSNSFICELGVLSKGTLWHCYK